jgi:hypothetical protein
LIGGVVGGVLSALPIVAAGNLCCCLWVISGGVVAAYVLQQRETTPITPADGALAGLLAGILGAFVYLVIAIPINILIAPIEREMMNRFVEQLGSLPPEFRDYATRSAAFSTVMIVVDFVVRIFIGAIFSTIGGLLGAMMFVKKRPPDTPPGVIDVTQP